MIEISLISLKFAALIVGGVFAAIGLLTNYRHEDGTVSKWGKRALYGIVLSTIIGAVTQGVESYRNRKAALANDAANRSVLSEIRRAVYPLRNIALTATIVYAANNPAVSKALEGFSFGKPLVPVNGHWPGLFSFDPRSPNYPKAGFLRDLIEPDLTVNLWRKGVDISKDDPDLRFALRGPRANAYLEGRSLSVLMNYVPVPDDTLVISQKIASLEDIRGAQIRLGIYVTFAGIGRIKLARDVLKDTQVKNLALHIANHPVRIALQPNEDSEAFEGTISEAE